MSCKPPALTRLLRSLHTERQPARVYCSARLPPCSPCAQALRADFLCSRPANRSVPKQLGHPVIYEVFLAFEGPSSAPRSLGSSVLWELLTSVGLWLVLHFSRKQARIAACVVGKPLLGGSGQVLPQACGCVLQSF
jgi:hypothetical protein